MYRCVIMFVLLLVVFHCRSWAGSMESDNEVNGSSGDDDDGLLDEDIAGGEDDILDDTELDYTEDILEEANEEQVVNDEKVSSLQDCVGSILHCVLLLHW